MILYLIRSNGIDMVELMNKSLTANNIQSEIPKKKKEIEECDNKLNEIMIEDCIIGAKVQESCKFDDIEDLGVCTGFSSLINNTNIFTAVRQASYNISQKCCFTRSPYHH